MDKTCILVTGAGGFVGKALIDRLIDSAGSMGIGKITAVDLFFGQAPRSEDSVLRRIHGSLSDASVRADALAERPDLVFHLAGITSGQAEQSFGEGLATNVTATIALFEDLRRLGHGPRLVQTSSIGVFGQPLPTRVDDATVPNPTLSYGAQKLMMEILLADYSRRGWIDGRSVRLPSVVARPAAPSGALSSFASDLIRELMEGRAYECPVDSDSTVWLMSITACVDSLLHAAAIDSADLPRGRAWTLPALRASTSEIAAAIEKRTGKEARVRYTLNSALIPQFARWPRLDTSLAESLGFLGDSSLDEMLERVERF